MRKSFAQILIIIITVSLANYTEAQTWPDNLEYQQHSPRYFGPNAFPIPETRSGLISKRVEAELRGEYHTYTGDKTKDIYARIFVPVANGVAGLEVSCVINEYYNMTPETVKERYAVEASWKNGARGDVIISSFYQLLNNEKWMDIMLDITLKTASGDRLADARYIDNTAYWFTLNIGRNLYKSINNTTSVRIQGYGGFYCWMTNDKTHRQNDAFTYSAEISGKYNFFSVYTGIAGFRGYINNGDRSIQIRTKMDYEYKENILSFRYKHGMKDCLYDSLSIAYIRCF